MRLLFSVPYSSSAQASVLAIAFLLCNFHPLILGMPRPSLAACTIRSGVGSLQLAGSCSRSLNCASHPAAVVVLPRVGLLQFLFAGLWFGTGPNPTPLRSRRPGDILLARQDIERKEESWIVARSRKPRFVCKTTVVSSSAMTRANPS